MTTGERIRMRREELGLTQLELAQRLGYTSNTTVAKLESGANNLRQSKIKALADALETTPDFIMGWSESQKPEAEHKAVRVPVLGYVAAGIPISAITDILDFEEVTPEMVAGRELFALKIKGDSMAPRICSGDVVICSSQPDAESGEICIIQVNGNEATCKRIRKHKDGIELIPINPSYEPMYYTSVQIRDLPVVILGKVIELRGKL